MEKTGGQSRQKRIKKKIEKNLMKIGIQDAETVAQSKNVLRQVCVKVMGFDGL